MYLDKRFVAGLLAVITLLLLYFKNVPTEHATGFYVVRPVGWEAGNFYIKIYFYSDSPLQCLINGTPFDINGLSIFTLHRQFRPGSFETINLDINCGNIIEKGTLTVFIST